VTLRVEKGRAWGLFYVFHYFVNCVYRPMLDFVNIELIYGFWILTLFIKFEIFPLFRKELLLLNEIYFSIILFLVKLLIFD